MLPWEQSYQGLYCLLPWNNLVWSEQMYKKKWKKTDSIFSTTIIVAWFCDQNLGKPRPQSVWNKSQQFANYAIPFVNPVPWNSFSYQNLSPFFKDWNCLAIMQANVGPTLPPTTWRSDRPPAYRSMSSGWLESKWQTFEINVLIARISSKGWHKHVKAFAARI